jgi:hypothetical protein
MSIFHSIENIFRTFMTKPKPPKGGDGKPQVLSRQPGCRKAIRFFIRERLLFRDLKEKRKVRVFSESSPFFAYPSFRFSIEPHPRRPSFMRTSGRTRIVPIATAISRAPLTKRRQTTRTISSGSAKKHLPLHPPFNTPRPKNDFGNCRKRIHSS